MQAERIVLAANDATLATCALRPSAIFGPGDRLMLPSVAARARAGKMRYIIGDGSNNFDWTYVGNLAAAHLVAAEALSPGSPAAGEAFFITNDEHYPFWTMMGDICEGLGYARPSVRLPVWLMMLVATVLVYACALLGRQSDLNPMRVRVCTVERTLSCEKAKRVLGYKPAVDMQRAIELTLESFQHLHKDNVDASKRA
jgi:nucleoside-diphosphate-sugar epimerase